MTHPPGTVQKLHALMQLISQACKLSLHAKQTKIYTWLHQLMSAALHTHVPTTAKSLAYTA